MQLPPPRFSFEEVPANIPLAAGFLVGALNRRQPGRFECVIVPTQVVDVLADAGLAGYLADLRPEVLALSLYVWNVQRSLYLAAAVRRLSPETRVVVGGPEVTPDNRWVMEHPAVHAGVFGEGESRIQPLLERLTGKMPVPPGKMAVHSEEPGDTSRQPVLGPIAGAFVKTDRGLVVDPGPGPSWDLGLGDDPYLSQVISPSLDGTLFLETLRGCPFKCGYCYYHKAYQGIRYRPEESVEHVLDMAYRQGSGVHEIYLMDPSFNAAPKFRKLLLGLTRRRAHKDLALHTELRADLLDRQDAAAFEMAGLKSAEVGLQTSDPRVLTIAGRNSDPDAVARGVSLLKDRNIDVTTGIILGLPGDSPEGFSATLAWLKEREAYSVVHPFVLSVLPGTDFRARSPELAMDYDPQPPYYVRSTPSFPRDAFRAALLECEQTFDMEIDHIPLPSLVDEGPEVIRDLDRASYVSKWILDPADCSRARGLVAEVARKAADPFTFWFRGSRRPASESHMIDILAWFSSLNPHCIVRVVLEFEDLPDPGFFDRAVDAAVHPGLYINRYYEPLLGENEVISLDFTAVVPVEVRRTRKRLIEEEYLPHAAIVYEVNRPFEVDLRRIEQPLLVSCHVEPNLADELLDLLLRYRRDRADEVLFRRADLTAKWHGLTRKSHLMVRFSEQILRT